MRIFKHKIEILKCNDLMPPEDSGRDFWIHMCSGIGKRVKHMYIVRYSDNVWLEVDPRLYEEILRAGSFLAAMTAAGL